MSRAHKKETTSKCQKSACFKGENPHKIRVGQESARLKEFQGRGAWAGGTCLERRRGEREREREGFSVVF